MIWLLSNLCRGKPSPVKQIKDLVLGQVHFLLNLQNEAAVEDTCWLLSYLSDGDIEGI